MSDLVVRILALAFVTEREGSAKYEALKQANPETALSAYVEWAWHQLEPIVGRDSADTLSENIRHELGTS